MNDQRFENEQERQQFMFKEVLSLFGIILIELAIIYGVLFGF